MLIKCPECELQVSDKALSCPHCGFPMSNQVTNKRKPRKRKYKRLPNGFGSITEIKDRPLRKPFLARVCIGKSDTGTPILRNLKPQAYFESYNDAYAALVEYNKNPYELDTTLTMEQLYEKWSAEYFSKISTSSVRTIMSAWNYCSVVYKMRVTDVRARHIKACMEDGTVTITAGVHKGEQKHTTPNIKSRIKSLFNLMLDYALEYELVNINYARTFNIDESISDEVETMRNAHIPFTREELNTLWLHKDDPYVDIILIQCYGGWRPQELGLLKLENINMTEWWIKGGMKTKAGTDRIVPIHPRIRDLVCERYEEAKNIGSDYLLNITDGITHQQNYMLTYDKYSSRFNKVMLALGLNINHRPHDPRSTFVTMAKTYGVDEFAIKRIVGHSFKTDITEYVYTERKYEWLANEMAKIK